MEEFMDLTKVKEILVPYLEKNNLTLYDVKWTSEYGYKVLQVFVDKAGGIDTDTLAVVNEYLSTELDKLDGDMGEYMLEVSSPGAEKELRNKEEVLENVGKYIFVKTDDNVYEGDFISFVNDVVVIRINIKGRMKNVNVNYSDIKLIRLAVKF